MDDDEEENQRQHQDESEEISTLATSIEDRSVASVPTLEPVFEAGDSATSHSEDSVDFGDEPSAGDVIDTWQCRHNFDTYDVPVKQALALNRHYTVLDCTKCWRPIYAEIFFPTYADGDKKT